MRTENINLWVLWLLIPVAMATYIFGADKKPEQSNVVFQTLVKQVQDLQVVVASQGERIEALEERLKVVEADDNNVKDTDNSIKSTKSEDIDADTGKDPDTENLFTDINDGHSIRAMAKDNGLLRRGIRAAADVAFSVYLDHKLDNLAENRTIKYNQVLFNDGNHYNTHSGVFTAPTSGVYFFTFNILDWQTGYVGAARLVVDDVHIVDAELRSGSDSIEMGGNSAVIRVLAGQVVWVQTFYDSTHLFSSPDERYVTFSGFLLY